MTARVLVVDDIAANVKLLEAKLAAEYFDVISAYNGPDGIRLANEHKPDIILLDVMMPGMDGFEVCRRLKSAKETAHIPVVMVTALDQPSDRVQGLDAGADDFLTKPVNDISLFARVKSLVRLKMMTDELRMREATGQSLGIVDASEVLNPMADIGGRVLLVEDRETTLRKTAEGLAGGGYTVDTTGDPVDALMKARENDFDLVILSLSLQNTDGMRLCSQLKSLESTRHTPILALVEEGDTKRLVRALEIGINDYLIRPIDKNELLARTKTQIKRKRYSDKLRQNLQMSLEAAITDQLTGLYNRRYMTRHLATQIASAHETKKPLSFLIMDIDFFKAVNDTYGHDVGDEILRGFASRLKSNVRGIDLACRYGGEEFVVIMPETDVAFAYAVAERLRQSVADLPFPVNHPNSPLTVTVSIGITSIEKPTDTSDTVLKRADQALYRAKRDGRNRVVAEAA
ncbi:MAG: PleD family two-component system response regulator [Alphaproteobacteria bacterium]|nr:PleD family two-component system response regulator [Alphaproteobacteria bacterium]